MALFGNKKKTEKKEAPTPVAKPATAQHSSGVRNDLAHVLKHARITEKATMQQGANVYVFDIAQTATKRDVMLAVHSLYGVRPRKVAVINIRSKNIRNMRTGRAGVKGGGKKAYVFLTSGQTITLS